MNDRKYRTAAEVALELGVSLRTVRRWVSDGRLRATRVGRSVRIPVDAYRGASLPASPDVAPDAHGRIATALRAGEGAADYAGRSVAPWPDSPERLAAQRRRAAELMDRLASRGRAASGSTDTADAIIDAVRDEFGAAGAAKQPGGELAGERAPESLGRRPPR